MAKRRKSLLAKIKLHVTGGQANPAPPVGPALGQHGLPIMEFCKAFNEATKSQQGITIPVLISVYDDKSFTFITKSPPASFLLKKACGIATASGNPGKEKAGTVSREQIKEIAKAKIDDLNAKDIDSAMKIIEGTARSMGIEIEK